MNTPESGATEFSPGSDAQPEQSQSRRSIWEVLLDPRTIQWVLMLGGALIVIGLIIWLASFEFFRQPRMLAIALGAATALVLGAGWFTALRTRFKIAGRALTFLACFVAPLNLWFYHHQGLITLEGHLWIGGLVCCIVYAVTAFMLRDPLFVYVVEGGITLTTLMILADLQQITDMPSLSLFLVVLGLVSLHAERAFSPVEGPFSRRRFGLPLFWSGQVQIGAGLAILLVAQALDWLRAPVSSLWGYQLGDLWRRESLLLPGGLWLVGAYAYLYSDIVVRRIGVYLYAAAFCLLWGVVTLVAGRLETEGIILVLALTAAAANVVQHLVTSQNEKLNRAIPPLAMFLSAVPVLMGVVLHMRATSELAGEWASETSWLFVVAMLVVAAGNRLSAYLYGLATPARCGRCDSELRDAATFCQICGAKVAGIANWSATYFFLSAAALIVAIAGFLRVPLGLTAWHQQAPLLMLVPIAYMAASRLWRGRSPEYPLAWIAHAAGVVMLVYVLGAALESPGSIFSPITGETTNLWLAVFFFEAAVFYVLASFVRGHGLNNYLAAAMACGALWQCLGYRDVPAAYHTVIYAGLGLAIVVVSRLVTPKTTQRRVMPAAMHCGNAVLSVAFVAAVLQALAHLAGRGSQWQVLTGLASTTTVSVLAIWLVGDSAWRRWYAATSVALAGLTFLMLNVLIELNSWQKAEIFCVVAGLAILAVSHVGRFREGEWKEIHDLVTLGLWMGSGLAAVPLMIAVIYYRTDSLDAISIRNEFALLTVTLLMLVTGYIWQFKATTLVGGSLLVLHLLVIVASVVYQPQVALGVYLFIGGGVLFACGIFLSVYRERLMRLPAQIAGREGVFRVIGWR